MTFPTPPLTSADPAGTDPYLPAEQPGAAAPMTAEVAVVDLSQAGRPHGPIRFRLDGDLFAAASKVPVGHLAEAVALRGQLSAGNLDPLFEFFDRILLDDSAARLRARSVDANNPVDHVDLVNILTHLIERWGLRPTQPSSTSSTPSGDGMSGPSSAAGDSRTAPILSTSPPMHSLT